MSDRADDVLDRIVDATRTRLDRHPERADLERRAREAAGVRRRGGAASLRESLSAPGVRVIAECKRQSPSAGVLRDPFDPVALARAYEEGGAAGISVVTEPQFFGGQSGWLPLVRRGAIVPVLQKDFVFTVRQLFEAALLGADAVLLIVRILPERLLGEMVAVAAELGLETVVEVHNAAELDRALRIDAARVVGINARDLRTFKIDLTAAMKLAAEVPPDRVVLIESGIGGAADVRMLLERGLRQYLVGEYLLRAPDPRAALAELVACG